MLRDAAAVFIYTYVHDNRCVCVCVCVCVKQWWVIFMAKLIRGGFLSQYHFIRHRNHIDCSWI